MVMLFKRLGIYSLCLIIAYLPVQRAHALLPPAAAVVLDIVGTTAASAAAADLTTKAVCGMKPWAAGDPVFLCNAKTPKTKWVSKAKGSAKWLALLGSLGYAVIEGQVKKQIGECRAGPDFIGRGFTRAHCLGAAEQKLATDFYSYNPDGYGYKLTETGSSKQNNGYGLIVETIYVDITAAVSQGAEIASFGSIGIRYSQEEKKLETDLTDSEFVEDFWQTSPQVPFDVWLPDFNETFPDALPRHPDPEWFPEAEPVTQPIIPAKPAPGVLPYPKPLPETHPDHRPATTPKPDLKPWYFPGELPGAWPEGWALPGPTPGDFPGEWPLKGSKPATETDTETKPGDGTDTGTDPDTGTDTGTEPENPFMPFPIPLPVTGPLTRSELEEVQAKTYAEAAQGVPDAKFSDAQQEIEDAMNNFINDKVNVDIPEFHLNPFGYFTYGGGQCIAFNFNLSVGGKIFSVHWDEHCRPFNEFVRPTLEWSLYLSTALYCYMTFTRTVRSI